MNNQLKGTLMALTGASLWGTLGIFIRNLNTFGLNGMGNLYITGLTNHDYELVLAVQMFYTVVSLIGALIMDLSYGLVDPRVRVDK